MGNTYRLNGPQHGLTFTQLKAKNWDSVRVDGMRTGVEFAVQLGQVQVLARKDVRSPSDVNSQG